METIRSKTTLIMEESKYYKPEIQEFHPGFEFEEESVSGLMYNKKIFRFNWFNLQKEIVEGLDSNKIRVKHLDREDIESLGWKFTNVNSEYFSLNGFNLTHRGSNYYTIYEDKGADEYSFRGHIKNKSELKRLMQQINIEKAS